MNIIAGALLRGEAQIITYDMLYLQRYGTVHESESARVGFGGVMGLIFAGRKRVLRDFFSRF